MSDAMVLEARVKDYISGSMVSIVDSLHKYENTQKDVARSVANVERDSSNSSKKAADSQIDRLKKQIETRRKYQESLHRYEKVEEVLSSKSIINSKKVSSNSKQMSSAQLSLWKKETEELRRYHDTRVQYYLDIGRSEKQATNAAIKDYEVRKRFYDGSNASNKELAASFSDTGDVIGKKFVGALKSAALAYVSLQGVRKVIGVVQTAREYALRDVKANSQLAMAIGYTSSMLQEQARITSDKLIIDSSEVTMVQSKIAAYVKNEEMIKRLLPSVLDFGAYLGNNTSAANMLGKAMGGTGAEMSQYGIKVAGVAGSQERLNDLMAKVNEKFGGQAVAVSESKGLWDALGVSITNFTKAVYSSAFISEDALTLQKRLYEESLTMHGKSAESTIRLKDAYDALQVKADKRKNDVLIAQEEAKSAVISGINQKNLESLWALTDSGNMKLLKKQREDAIAEAERTGANVLYVKQKYTLLFDELRSKQHKIEMARIAEAKQALDEMEKISPNRETFGKQEESRENKRISNIQRELEINIRLSDEKEKQNKINISPEGVKKEQDNIKKVHNTKMGAIESQSGYMLDSIAMVAKASKAGAGVQKGLDIAQATAATAIAVTKNLATPWMIPFIIAMGAAQVSLIASQKYAGGGVVGGGSPLQGDVVPAMLTPGEMILNGQQQSNLFNQLNRPNVSNSSNAVNLNISVGSGGNYDMNAARYTVDQLIPILGDALVQAKSQGRLRDYEAAR